MVYITITGVYKPRNITGEAHIVVIGFHDHSGDRTGPQQLWPIPYIDSLESAMDDPPGTIPAVRSVGLKCYNQPSYLYPPNRSKRTTT